MKRIIITLDGPAGSGKSTVARELARRIRYTYLDTGAMYRAITLAVLKAGVKPADAQTVVDLLDRVTLDIRYEGGEQKTFLNGQDVSRDIRDPKVTDAVSQVSSIAEVRAFLVSQQQSIARDGGYVLDGRDAGTVIFPGAELKFFLTAAVRERARRRLLELSARDIAVPLEQMIEELEVRDVSDSTRAISPLKKADDAMEIDNTHLSVEDQVQMISRIFQDRITSGN